MKRLGFIGTGNMATAIISSISRAALDAKIYGYDLDAAKLESLKSMGLTPIDSMNALCGTVDYLVLSVKPQNFTDVLSTIAPDLPHDTVVISIAAGITADAIRRMLGFDAKVVRVMPNTPLMLSCGASAMCKTDNVSDDEFAFAQEIFNCAGISKVIPTDKMNEIISINGSSPAFIYEFARHFIAFGEQSGIDSQVCMDLFAQTLIGSAQMMLQSGKPIEELIAMVTSKGGTTIAGLESLRENGFGNIVQKACERCTERAYELEKSVN